MRCEQVKGEGTDNNGVYPLRFYSAQLVLALEYLHHVGVVYRDLVPDNVTVDGSGYLKLWWLLGQQRCGNVECEL